MQVTSPPSPFFPSLQQPLILPQKIKPSADSTGGVPNAGHFYLLPTPIPINPPINPEQVPINDPLISNIPVTPRAVLPGTKGSEKSSSVITKPTPAKPSHATHTETAWRKFFENQAWKGVLTGVAALVTFMSPPLAAIVDGLGRLVGMRSDQAQYNQGHYQAMDSNKEATITKGRALVQGVTDVTRLVYSGLSMISNVEPVLSLTLSMTIVGGIAAGLSLLSSAFSLVKYREDIVVKIPKEETKLNSILNELNKPDLSEDRITALEKKYFKITHDGNPTEYHQVPIEKQSQYQNALIQASGRTVTDPKAGRVEALRTYLTILFRAQQKEREGQWWGIAFRTALMGANISQLTLLSVGIVGFAALASNPVGWGIAGALMVGFLSLSVICLLQSTRLRLDYREVIKPATHGLTPLFEDMNDQWRLNPRFQSLLIPVPNEPTKMTGVTNGTTPITVPNLTAPIMLVGCA